VSGRDTLFHALDKDGNTKVTKAEFLATLYVPHWPIVKIFRSIDTDDDGCVTKKELFDFLNPKAGTSESSDRNQLKEMLHRARPVSKHGHLFESLDTDHNGKISKQEFLRALVVEHWDLVEIFRFIDTDNSGSIEASELHAFLKGKSKSAAGWKASGDLSDEERLRAQLITKLKDAQPQHGKKYKTLFAALDAKSPDGHVSLDDFVTALYVENTELLHIFRRIDVDNDGVVTPEELRTFLKDSKSVYVKHFRAQLALTRPVKRKQKLFRVLDQDHNGSVTQSEFMTALAIPSPPLTQVLKSGVKKVQAAKAIAEAGKQAAAAKKEAAKHKEEAAKHKKEAQASLDALSASVEKHNAERSARFLGGAAFGAVLVAIASVYVVKSRSK